MITITREVAIIIGERELVLQELRSMLPPETVYAEFATFGIDDSKWLKSVQARRREMAAEQFWVLSFAAMTLEAQNALLKTLEEPGRGHRFVLVTAARAELLPTLLSRAELIERESSAAGDETAKKFLHAEPEARLDHVQKLLKLYEGEPALARVAATTLVNEIESLLHSRGVTVNNRRDFEALIQARDYLGDRAAMPRLILEHLALILPVLH